MPTYSRFVMLRALMAVALAAVLTSARPVAAQPQAATEIRFSASGYTVSEAGPSASLLVLRTGDTSGASSVEVVVANPPGTATPGADYTFTSPTTVTWAAGDAATKTVVVPLIDDAVFDTGETVGFALRNPTGGTLGSPNTTTLTITDNEPLCPADDGFEPNDSRAAATPLANAQTLSAVICANDSDFYALTASAGSTISVSVEFFHDAGDLDLRLTDASGTVLDESTGINDLEVVQYTVPSTGTYYAEVFGFEGAENSYTIGALGLIAETATPPPDFDGDGDTDRAVYRNGAWYAEGQPTQFLGQAGDIPVPADYDGDGDTERAVYREGAWYIEEQATVFHGLPGDVPVPADYDGDGDAEPAVFRPSVGAWYVLGQAPMFHGLASDIPVPADYDGDGDTDIAVWRPSVGGWYVVGQSTQFRGLSGDIPVPGDYDADGDTDRMVWRPSVGGWYLAGQTTIFLGLNGDWPVPGDYDGDGDTERAVWRPAAGAWYVHNQPTVFLGLNGDVPLPLPNAIARNFF